MINLSVIIPVYNTPDALLQACIMSLKANKGEEFEFILVDDGSDEPHVLRQMDEACHHDKRFRRISKEHSGLSATRNKGLGYSNGEYVMFVDSDDCLEADACRYAVDTMERTGCDVAIFGHQKDEKPVTSSQEYRKRLMGDAIDGLNRMIISHRFDELEKYGISPVYAHGKIYKKSVLNEFNIRFLTESKNSEDVFFNLDYNEHIQSVYIDNHIIYHYVSNPQSKTRGLCPHFVAEAPNNILLSEQYLKKYNHLSDASYRQALRLRALWEIRVARNSYFCHPENDKSFPILKKELRNLLQTPPLKKWAGDLRLCDADDIISRKNILLLRLSLYWLYLLTK